MKLIQEYYEYIENEDAEIVAISICVEAIERRLADRRTRFNVAAYLITRYAAPDKQEVTK